MKINIKIAHIFEIIIGIAFICLSIFHTNEWFDEAYSIAIAKHSFAEIWTIGGNDVHPILYYWILHIIGMCTNYSILAYRIFSAIPIAILGILGFTHIRKDFGEKVGFIFSLLVFFMPVMGTYAGQVRMYSLAILAVTILAIYAYRIFKGATSNKTFIIFGISSLVSIYTHYYGLMTAGLINLFLFIYLIIKKRKSDAIKIGVMGGVQIIFYIPWLINFATQIRNVSGGFWIGFTFPQTLVELLSFEFIGDSIRDGIGAYQYIIFALTMALYVYIFITAKRLHKQGDDTKPIKFSAIIYGIVILAAILVTIAMRTSIVHYRYLFVITGLYIFILSFVLSKEKNVYITCGICTIIILLGFVNNTRLIKNGYDSSNKALQNYLEQNISEEDDIVYTDVLLRSNGIKHIARQSSILLQRCWMEC